MKRLRPVFDWQRPTASSLAAISPFTTVIAHLLPRDSNASAKFVWPSATLRVSMTRTHTEFEYDKLDQICQGVIQYSCVDATRRSTSVCL